MDHADAVEVEVGARGRWAVYALVTFVLGGLELAVAALLAHRFLPDVLALAVDGIGVAALVLGTWWVATVCWRRHRLEAGSVTLVLGRLASIRVPIADIESVAAVAPLAGVDSSRTGPAFEEDGAVLLLTPAAGVPRVRLDLAREVVGRRLWHRHAARAVEAGDPRGEVAAAVSLAG